MAPRQRSAGDTEVDAERLRALEARQVETTGPERDAAPFIYRPGMPADVRSLTNLQRSAGNAAVGTMLRARTAGASTRPHPVRPPIALQRRAAQAAPPQVRAPATASAGNDTSAATTESAQLDEPSFGETGGFEESILIGESGGAPKGGAAAKAAGEGAEAAAAAQSGLQAAAQGERAEILADRDASDAALDEELAEAQGKLSGHVATAKKTATGAINGARIAAQGFITQQYRQVTAAVDSAEGIVNLQATALAAQAGAEAVATTEGLRTKAKNAGELVKGAAGFAERISNSVRTVSLPDLPGVGMIRNGIANLVGGAARGVTAGVGVVKGIIDRALDWGLGVVGRLIGMARNGVLNIVGRITNALRSAAQKAATALNNIASRIARTFTNLLQLVVFPNLDRLKTVASKYLVGGHKRAKQAVKLNTDHHLAALDKVAKTAVPVVGAAKGGPGAGADDPKATFKAIGDKSKQNNKMVVDTAGGRFGSVLSTLWTRVQGIAHQVADKAKGIGSQIVSTVGGIVGPAIALVFSIGAAAGRFATNVFNKARQLFKQTLEWISDVVSSPVQSIVSFGTNAFNLASSFIGRAISNVLSGNFSLPSLGLGAFRPGTANAAQVPVDGAQATLTSESTSVLQIVGIVVAALAGLVLLPFIIGGLGALLLAACAALVIMGPLLAVIAAVVYGLYRLIKWIATPSPLTLEHTTSLQAPDGSPKTRTTIGVGERVTIKANKLSTFKASTGDPTSTSPKPGFTWRAPFTPGAAEVTASLVDKSMTEKVAFEVIEPSSVTAKKDKDKDFPAGQQGAGMVLNFLYGPSNVSFGGGGAREKSGKASAVTGYYLREGMPHDHGAKPDFCAIDENNLLAGENRDHASQFGQPKPWEKGSFHWMIPNEFRADEDAAPKVFTTTKQEFVITEDGTTTITKAGASTSRKP